MTDRAAMLYLATKLSEGCTTRQQQFEHLAALVISWCRLQPNPKFAVDEFHRLLRTWRFS